MPSKKRGSPPKVVQSVADKIKAWRDHPTDDNLEKLLSGAATRSDVQQEFDKKPTRIKRQGRQAKKTTEEDSNDVISMIAPYSESSEIRSRGGKKTTSSSSKAAVVFVPKEEDWESVDVEESSDDNSDDYLEEPDVYANKVVVAKGKGRVHKDTL